MIGQKTINSFFSPVSKKRISKDVNESEKDAKHPKKPKSSAVESEVSSPAPAPLSPDQLERIARNKRAAMERRTSAQTPPGFGESWREGLSEEFEKPYFKTLMDFVSKERTRCTVYPPAEEVFTWTQMCDIRDVKVVILGQDPYHGPDQAHGLCFSVKKPVRPPPSLENMYKELVTDIEGFQHPRHGDLTGWSEQGVLLLNAVLTVRASNANSHKDRGWETFTDAKKGAAIDRERHHVLQTVHPSPLSAHRGFFGCSHFSKANELLVQSGKSPINWKSL
ncbi:Uracil-DNA glycosylase [Dissostichus eleginoides]|uniref:Uracil-DNA glycosylase n=1 Tax=Dissostichus eleginoides TaxID=100907 RepID=A0AAD9C1F5_DISEL|nr:Uracil-DNA glycosylase [Dissostichus eleginoides]